MSNELHQLHDQASESLVRNLSKRVPGLCRSAGDISQTAEALAGRSPARIDEAQGKPDAFGDFGGSEGPIA